MAAEFRCDGCRRARPDDELFLCLELHRAVELSPDTPVQYVLCAGCYEAHAACWQARDGSHWPEQEYLH